jgi:hypothetical protein
MSEMEVELPFSLFVEKRKKKKGKRPTHIHCKFPPEPTVALETLRLRDKSDATAPVHDIEISGYTAWVRFENAFDRRRLLAQAQYQPASFATDVPYHTIVLEKKARLIVMAVHTIDQMERQLELMKRHLLTGTFDDDEEQRGCVSIMSAVEGEGQFDWPPLRRKLEMAQKTDQDGWSTKHTLGRLMQLAGLAQRDVDFFDIETRDNMPMDNVGGNKGASLDCDVKLWQRSGGRLIIRVDGDRHQLLIAHCALHRIMAPYYRTVATTQ